MLLINNKIVYKSQSKESAKLETKSVMFNLFEMRVLSQLRA